MTSRLNTPFFAGVCMLFLISLVAVGCASAPIQQQGEIPAKRPISEIVKKDVHYPIDAYDPWEGMNRRIYRFNALLDQYVLLPVVGAYEFITPDVIEKGISNFFNNLHEIKPLCNSLLQFKFKKLGITFSRILINTTMGVGGVMDVATSFDIQKQNEDFGQTLGFYGLHPGPYLVLPFFGPSTLRDTGGLVVDTTAYSVMTDAGLAELIDDNSDEALAKAGLTLFDVIDTRHQQSFRYYSTGSPFEYENIRMLYLKSRQFKIEH
jgi:phospholipid-binding lipoprotein MlaA